jgi:hypothetical protein
MNELAATETMRVDHAPEWLMLGFFVVREGAKQDRMFLI